MRRGATREEQDQNREEEGAGTIHRREAFSDREEIVAGSREKEPEVSATIL
jgi:hypothetical protein